MERRTLQFAARVQDQLSKLGPIKQITLTLPQHVALDRASIKHLRTCFHKLKRDRLIKACLHQHVYFLEATPQPDGWHLHMHILFAGKYIPQKYLSRAWKRISGASNVDIREKKSLKAVLAHLTTYCSKPAHIESPERQVEFLRAVQGTRLFACCNGLKPLPKETAQVWCPECGGKRWRLCWPDDPADHVGDPRYHIYTHPAFRSLTCIEFVGDSRASPGGLALAAA